MTERLTIAIPFYAGLEYLALALESVRAQEDADWTLLVVDDSLDRCGARELVAGLGDARVRYAANPGNLGMVACWNRCLDLAEGELVTLLHGDDRLLPGYVRDVRALAARHPDAVGFFTPATTIDAAGRPLVSLQDDIKRWFVPRGAGDVVLRGEPGLRAVMRGNFIVCPSVCWRRCVLGERRFDARWRQVQDLELTARLLLAGDTLAGSRVPAYAYRRHAENATARQTESLLRFAEEFELFDVVAANAGAAGWRSAARTARHKGIVRAHLGWRTLRALASGRPGEAARFLGVLAGVEPVVAGAGLDHAVGEAPGELAGGTGGVFLSQIAGMGLAFGTTLVLTRALPTEEYGALAYTLTWAEVLGLMAPLGFDKLLIRDLAHARAEASWAHARGILRAAARWTALGVLVGVGAVLGFWRLLDERLDPAIVAVFWMAALLVPLRAWVNLRHGALLGLSRPVAGMLATSVTPALVLLPVLGCLWVFVPSFLDARTAAAAAALGWVVSFLVADRHAKARLDREAMRRTAPEEHGRAWLAEALPILLIVAMALLCLRASEILLGSLRGAREAGIYFAASQLASLVRLGLVAVNPALAPLVVRAKEPRALQSVAARATRLAFLPAAGVAVLLLIGGSFALRLYGAEFADGTRALGILALGFLVIAALGPVETILLMKNQQRLAAVAAAGACGLNVLLNVLLIPPLGMEGAALATATSMIVWSVAMSLAIRRRLGIAMHLFAGAAARDA